MSIFVRLVYETDDEYLKLVLLSTKKSDLPEKERDSKIDSVRVALPAEQSI